MMVIDWTHQMDPNAWRYIAMFKYSRFLKLERTWKIGYMVVDGMTINP